MGKVLDMSGKKFGRWTVLSSYKRVFPKPDDKYFDIHWECCCECGVIEYVRGKNLRIGESLSCGCLAVERYTAAVTSHGMSRKRIYKIWQGMKRRCENEKYIYYKNYGARGISVCERWHTFENFFADMAERYRDDLTIERNDNDGNYEPGNCCWIPKGDQMKNRRKPMRNRPDPRDAQQTRHDYPDRA